MTVGGRAVQGMVWNLGLGLGVRVLGLVGTMVLTRFIAPYEYGEVSAASICVLTATMFTTFGFGQYVIAFKSGPEETFHGTVFHVLLGVLAFAVVLSLGGPLGRLTDAPHMARFMPGLALAAMLERVQYMPERILARDLRFRTIAMNRAVGEIAFTSVALALAWKWGGWAIVWANVARASLVTTLMVRAADRRAWLTPAPLRADVARRLFGYGLPINLGGALEFVSGRWDNLLVSGFFGPQTMGKYAIAYNLAETPTGAVADQIGAVLLPSYAQLSDADRARAFPRSARLMALIVFPLAVGLGAVAPTVVQVFFDPRWHEMGQMLAILSVLSLVRPLTWTMISYTHAQRRPWLMVFTGVVKAGALVALVLAARPLGILWVCAAVGVAFVVYALVFLYALHRVERVAFWSFLAGAVGPLLACGVMAAAVLAVRAGATHAGVGVGPLRLVVEIATGALVYAGAALVLARATARDFLNLLGNALGRRRG